ncbi:MAG: cobalt ECF transporter T component CbiQ [Alphaproteobacteria bacterium]|nr:cobalt ECF transporter T component CbiQ [Alphaproteobacteria bacterium]
MSVRALPAGRATFLPAFQSDIDPRARILATVAFAVVTASLHDVAPIAAALAVAIGAALLSGLGVVQLARRLVILEGFMVLLLCLLPFTVPGRALLAVGPFAASAEGLSLAVAIALKAGAVVVAILSQLGTLEPARLGHGLARLGVPRKLVAVLLLTVRYVSVFEDEYRRLRRAMQARGFEARSSRHTWRSLGWLLGMLLVRSNDRAARVLQAMKCRGFNGRFHIIADLTFTRADAAYLGLGFIIVAGLALWGWL